MEIILQGNLNPEDTCASLSSVLRLFKDRYHIESFREIHLHVTLIDEYGDEVELVNTETNESYRVFEIRQENQPVTTKPHQAVGNIHLVIDNTHSKGTSGKKK